MSDSWDWAESARIERARLRERPDPNTGFYDVLEDEFWEEEPEDEENESGLDE